MGLTDETYKKVSLGFEPRFTDIIQEILNRYPLFSILIVGK